MRKSTLLMSLLMLIGFSTIAAAQSKKSIVGTWKLVAVKSTTLKGVVNPNAFGKGPTGFATFTRTGRVSIIMSNADRKLLSVPDRVAAPMKERARAFATCIAYAGTYTVKGDTVILHIQAATMQNWVNTNNYRHLQWDGPNRLSLTTRITLKGGVRQHIETTWVRVG
ncbi:MAG TPA: lipocalin-like domain-containing protein [Candidatus Dormibacteraeota bacterium]|nr:lipocalin-like domain-containing protein [Candidatus Dormibacteraeota bacterium]